MGTMCDNFIIYEDNQNEFKMWQGLVGAHYTPYVDGAGNLSWTNNGGLPNPPTVNVTGKGLTITGMVATTGDLPATSNQFDTYLVGTSEPYYAYMYYENAWVNIGAVGKGEQGEPGFSPVVTVSPITGGHQISITDAEDTETFNVMDGADGQDGVGVPTGGTAGQVLAKRSGTNYDTEWVNQSGGADPATVAPLMDGTAAVGTATKYAREDHVHPTDTSRQETLVSGTNIKTINNNSLLGSGDITIGGAVDSVNGQTGTVVLDADDVGAMSKWELLWTNASPLSDFNAQTLSIDLSDYDAVLIAVTRSPDTGYTQKFYSLMLVGEVGIIQYVTASATNVAFIDRYFTVSSSGIDVTAAHLAVQGSASSQQDRTRYLIPYKIFGIKGVVTA